MGAYRNRVGVLPVCVLLAVSATLAAEPEQSQAGARSGGVELVVPEAARASSSFDVERATRGYLDQFTPEEKKRSDSYFVGGYWLQLWGFLYGLGVAWLLLGTGLSARMRDRAEQLTRFRPVQTFIYAAQYILLTTLLLLPLTVYQGFFREHKYGLATQTFGPWIGEQLKGLLIGLLMGGILLTVLYGVFRRAPRTWWVWGSVVGVVFIIFGATIAPVFIAPVFNDYKPLEEGPIRNSILSMARANGIPADDVYWFDASRQTTRISANVSGFFGTTRISLNDNLLNRASPEEIQSTMGHELGHYALNHGPKLVIYFGLLLVGGFLFVYLSFDYVLRRWGAGWQVRGIGDVAGLPLLAALISVYFFVATPVGNTIVRVTEAEADIFGLNAARRPDGFANIALKLGEYRKMEPGHVEEIFFFDHPSGRARINMAMTWKAEHMKARGKTP